MTQDDSIAQIQREVHELAVYFKTRHAIHQFFEVEGNRIFETWVDFYEKIERELSQLEFSREKGHTIEGAEWVYRSNVLFFALMIAKMYFTTTCPNQDWLNAVDKWLQRAEKLTR